MVDPNHTVVPMTLHVCTGQQTAHAPTPSKARTLPHHARCTHACRGSPPDRLSSAPRPPHWTTIIHRWLAISALLGGLACLHAAAHRTLSPSTQMRCKPSRAGNLLPCNRSGHLAYRRGWRGRGSIGSAEGVAPCACHHGCPPPDARHRDSATCHHLYLSPSLRITQWYA